MKSQICVDHDASAPVHGPAESPSHEPGARRRTLRMPSEGSTHAETTKCCELGSCRRDYPGDGLLLRHSVGSGNFASTWPLASGRRPHLGPSRGRHFLWPFCSCRRGGIGDPRESDSRCALDERLPAHCLGDLRVSKPSSRSVGICLVDCGRGVGSRPEAIVAITFEWFELRPSTGPSLPLQNETSSEQPITATFERGESGDACEASISTIMRARRSIRRSPRSCGRCSMTRMGIRRAAIGRASSREPHLRLRVGRSPTC